jgi:hypothetical protein
MFDSERVAWMRRCMVSGGFSTGEGMRTDSREGGVVVVRVSE